MKDLLGSLGGAAGRAGAEAAAPQDVRIEIAGEAPPGEAPGGAGSGSAVGLGDFFAQVRLAGRPPHCGSGGYQEGRGSGGE